MANYSYHARVVAYEYENELDAEEDNCIDKEENITMEARMKILESELLNKMEEVLKMMNATHVSQTTQASMETHKPRENEVTMPTQVSMSTQVSTSTQASMSTHKSMSTQANMATEEATLTHETIATQVSMATQKPKVIPSLWNIKGLAKSKENVKSTWKWMLFFMCEWLMITSMRTQETRTTTKSTTEVGIAEIYGKVFEKLTHGHDIVRQYNDNQQRIKVALQNGDTDIGRINTIMAEKHATNAKCDMNKVIAAENKVIRILPSVQRRRKIDNWLEMLEDITENEIVYITNGITNREANMPTVSAKIKRNKNYEVSQNLM